MRRILLTLCAALLVAGTLWPLQSWFAAFAPAPETLSWVEGRVMQASGACTGPRGGHFVLSLAQGDRVRDVRLACDERFRSAAVGGTQVRLGLSYHNGPSPHILNATVDGRTVVYYQRERTQRRILYAQAGLAAILFGVYLAALLRVAGARRGKP